MSEYSFIDLFSGCGGLALGFRNAGFRSVWAVEMDRDAAATYEANFGHGVYQGRIEDVRLQDLPMDAIFADVIIGGPPCQGFSSLGRMSPRAEHAIMNELWNEFMRIEYLVWPKAVLIENVPQFLQSDQGRTAMNYLESRGYNVQPLPLNAHEFGVPQKRRRGFIMGVRGGRATFPQSRGERHDVRWAFSEPTVLERQPTGQNWHVGRRPLPVSLERYHHIRKNGGDRFDLYKLDRRRQRRLIPPCWQKKRTGSTDVFGRLSWEKPSVTIRTEFYKPEKGRYLHPEEDRPITHREAMRIQTFPDDFRWCGGLSSVARQVGNAVPPKLAYEVAVAMREALDEMEEAHPRE